MKQHNKPALRGISGALLVSFWVGFGTILSDLNGELAGAIFLMLAVPTLGYFVITWWLVRRGKMMLTPARIKTESLAFASLIAAASLGATFDTFPEEPFLVFLFAECFALLVYVAYLLNKDQLTLWGPVGHWGKRRHWLAAFGIAVTIALLVMTAYEFEPVVNLLAVLYFIVLLFLGVRWLFNQRRQLISMKQAQTQLEVVHLQSQVSPHFFFNALNNLYGMVKQDADQAQEMILQLSDLMSYGIYEGQREWVSLAKEVAYLENYIRLHRVRYRKEITVNFTQEVMDPTMQVMPLLFINLLENAFKHGVEKLRQDAFVSLVLRADAAQISFTVENNFDPEELPETPGVGLVNLRRRLALVYPDRHTLTTTTAGNFFQAHLTLTPA